MFYSSVCDVVLRIVSGDKKDPVTMFATGYMYGIYEKKIRWKKVLKNENKWTSYALSKTIF